MKKGQDLHSQAIFYQQKYTSISSNLCSVSSHIAQNSMGPVSYLVPTAVTQAVSSVGFCYKREVSAQVQVLRSQCQT